MGSDLKQRKKLGQNKIAFKIARWMDSDLAALFFSSTGL